MPRNLYEWIQAINDYFGLPQGLLLMIAYQENGKTWNFKTTAVNYNSGAKGAMQLTSPTIAQIFKISGFSPNPFDIIQAAYGAGIYLKWLHAYFGDWRAAIAAYNRGFGNIRNIIRYAGFFDERRLPPETKSYMFVANYLGL